MSAVTIRSVTPADYDDVIAMLTQIAALHHRGRPDLFYGSGAKYTHADLAALAAKEGFSIFIADTPSVSCAGYLFCQIADTEAHAPMKPYRRLWIDDLFVRPEARRDGVGSALLAHARAFAAEKHCERVELNVWEFNEAAIAFYARNGFSTQRRIMEETV